MSDQSRPDIPTSSTAPANAAGVIVLPAVALIAAIVLEIVSIIGSWGDFSRLGDFDGLRSSIIVLEAIARVAVLVIAPIPLLVVLVERRSSFPTLFTRWAVALPALTVVGLVGSYIAFNGSYIPGDTSFYGRNPWIEFIVLTIIAFRLAAILRRSAAAKITFVK